MISYFQVSITAYYFSPISVLNQSSNIKLLKTHTDQMNNISLLTNKAVVWSLEAFTFIADIAEAVLHTGFTLEAEIKNKHCAGVLKQMVIKVVLGKLFW